MEHTATPQEGIVKAILAKEREGLHITKENKIQFKNCLDWLIDNTKEKEKLAEFYLLRGNVYAGLYPNLCK